MAKIAYITNAGKFSGVGLRAAKIKSEAARAAGGKRFVEFNVDGERAMVTKEGRPIGWVKKWPSALGKKPVNWIRLGRVLGKYLLDENKRKYDIWHATNQTLSFLSAKFSPTVVTVHDIIEAVEPQAKHTEWLNKYLLSGIKKAEIIIAVSEYTARMVRDFYGIEEQKIRVVYNGVSSDFYKIDNFKNTIEAYNLRQELRIGRDPVILLFVGSDHPRKNLVAGIRVLKEVLKELPGAVLVKVGAPGSMEGRKKALEEVERLKLRDKVRFVNNVSVEKLNSLYNLADILLFPSKFEGFGLPLVEAMAAGLPIVASNSTSVPEVVGDAAITHGADDIRGMATSVADILQKKELAEDLRRRGGLRAKQFSWQRAAVQVLDVYDELL